MPLYTDIQNVPAAAKGCVLAIGNFDGVHLGHRALISKTIETARKLNVPAGVMTFEPHPREFFQTGGEPFRLTLLPMKERLISARGVEYIFAVPFDRALASLSAESFIALLKEKLNARHVVVGADFSFGKGKTGNTDTLRQALETTVMPPVLCPAGEAYSSTRIRGFLREGKLDEAAALLGRRWEIEAPVVHGNKKGRELGFPTANQNIPRLARIPYGVYAVEALIEKENSWRGGVANFGIRPMFRVNEPLFETFIFNFTQDIYEKTLRVRPLRRLRGEMAFESLDALKARMKQDCLEARAVLESFAGESVKHAAK